MNIAHVLSAAAFFPLKAHHGRFEWALRFAKAQAAQGHTVTIYCKEGSGEGIPEIIWKSVPYVFSNNSLQCLATMKMALQDTDHEIIHSHLDCIHYFVADATSTPVIFTQHWFPGSKVGNAATFNTSGNVLAVPVTNYMREENTRLGIPSTKTIYHGIDLQKFAYSDKPRSDRFVFVGRIAPHKGIAEIVHIAKAANIPLDIIGKLNDSDKDYWRAIEPLVDGQQIRYLGSKSQDEIVDIFSIAKAFLFAPQIEEAFGQTIIEAQACGTPVIVGSMGASSELVQHGKTGFVAHNETEYLEAIATVEQIDSAACRSFAEQFNSEKMISEYNKLYEDLLERK